MPNFTIDITQIVVAILGLLSALITYRLVPYIKSKTTVQQQAFIKAAVQTAVFAAEQIYGAGEGEKKFDYAIKWLHDHGYDVSKTDIEAAVYELINSPFKVATLDVANDEE